MAEQTLSESQRIAFERIKASITNPSAHLNANAFLIRGAAGSGKTFLLNHISRHCRNEDVNAIAFAYTGTATCELFRGKTVHSRFRIPWNRIICGLEPDGAGYKAILKASVLLWDQAACCNRLIFEEINRFLQNMMNSKQLFGGKVVIVCADFRECLPIVKKIDGESEESYSFLFSALCGQMQHYVLRENFRLRNAVDLRFCLNLGLGAPQNVIVPNECRTYDLTVFLNTIYGPCYSALSTDEVMSRSILTVLSKDVNYLNKVCLQMFSTSVFVCESHNYFRKIDPDRRSLFYSMETVMQYLPKYFPKDILRLSKDCPIVLTQSYKGMPRGSRLVVKDITNKKIIAEIGVGERKGKLMSIFKVLTPKTFPPANLEFIRRQFPVSLAFSMTINKAQGLEFTHVGLYFQSKVFSHGQMYVALSRTPTISENVKVFIPNQNDESFSYDQLPNVVNPHIVNHLLPNNLF